MLGAGQQKILRANAGSTKTNGWTHFVALGIDVGRTDMSFFAALINSSVFTGAVDNPSTLLNTIGICKDLADTNYFFMYNNAAGSATKVDTGIGVVASIQHLLTLNIACDALGNITMQFSDIDANLTKVITIPTATAKLPGPNLPLWGQNVINTGSITGTVVTMAFFKYVQVGAF